MKITIKCGSSNVRTFRNKRNENKYLETKKYDDGHTVSRGYMKWDTPEGEVKNYMGSKTNRGRWHRMRQGYLNELVDDDYEELEPPDSSQFESLESCDYADSEDQEFESITSANRIMDPWVMIGEYEDGYSTEMGGNDIGDCVYKLDKLTDRHGELIWYGGLNDEYYVDGEFVGQRDVTSSIDSSQTTNKIKIKNDTYNKLYDFDGGTYYTPDGAEGEEAWVATMDDGSVQLLYDGRHIPWEDAEYEVVESSEDAISYGWDDVWSPYSGAEQNFQSCYIDGEKVGSVEGWSSDGDFGYNAYAIIDGNKEYLGNFRSREKAQLAVEDKLDM